MYTTTQNEIDDKVEELLETAVYAHRRKKHN
jgi:hypothetical protein